MNQQKPLIIIGAHRSGTTFTGNMISLSDEVCYIRDPFAKYRRAGLFQLRPKNFFTYITDVNGNEYHEAFQQMIQFKYSLFKELSFIKKSIDIKPLLGDIFRFKVAKLKNKQALLKAATALFSTEWLQKNFDFRVLALIRHPAAFISSLKRLDITHPFVEFVNQPLLLRDHLQQFESKINEYSQVQLKAGHTKTPDIIDQGILLWNIIYSFMLKMREKHPEWLMLNHEDISLEPIDHFEKIYEHFQLNFTDGIKTKIIEYTSQSNPSEAVKGKWNSLKRNSSQNVKNWRHRLSPDEISKIYDGTNEIAKNFYKSEDW